MPIVTETSCKQIYEYHKYFSPYAEYADDTVMSCGSTVKEQLILKYILRKTVETAKQ
jgi:hypothetical protein